jgi:hypothetical protein
LATYNAIYKLRKVKHVFKKEAMDVAEHDRKSRPKYGRNPHPIRNSRNHCSSFHAALQYRRTRTRYQFPALHRRTDYLFLHDDHWNLWVVYKTIFLKPVMDYVGDYLYCLWDKKIKNLSPRELRSSLILFVKIHTVRRKRLVRVCVLHVFFFLFFH